MSNGRGTSRQYAMRRLRAEVPDLHDRVLAGEMSAHAAMVAAGLTPPTFTVRGTAAHEIVRVLRRRLDPEVLAEVARMLAA